MSAIETLKSVCIDKPFRSFKNLVIGTYYVQNFQRSYTNYGDRIRVELFDCFVYLPARFSNILSDEHLSELNDYDNVAMTYAGRDSKYQERLLLEFDVIKLDVDDDVF